MHGRLVFLVELMSIVVLRVSNVAGGYLDQCLSDVNCTRHDVNMECRWSAGCLRGQCRCVAGHTFYIQSCRRVRSVGQSCRALLDKCVGGAACVEGACACREGRFPDTRGHCTRGIIQLNQPCSDVTDCKEYWRNSRGAVCRANTTNKISRCLCGSSHVQDNNYCRRAAYGESCAAGVQCEPPLSCQNETCDCQANTTWSATLRQCRHNSAVTVRGLFAPCSLRPDGPAARVCAPGLACTSCPEWAPGLTKCVNVEKNCENHRCLDTAKCVPNAFSYVCLCSDGSSGQHCLHPEGGAPDRPAACPQHLNSAACRCLQKPSDYLCSRVASTSKCSETCRPLGTFLLTLMLVLVYLSAGYRK